jgi:hypothetical protein
MDGYAQSGFGCQVDKMEFPGTFHKKIDWLHAPASTVLRCTLMLGLVSGLVGCLVIPEDKTYQSLVESEKSGRQIYKLYPGKQRPASELAVAHLNDIPSVTVDGLSVLKTDYQEIHLLPGRHALAWRKVFGFSVMVEPPIMKEEELAIEVGLKAGHSYKLFADRTTGNGYRFYFWVEDVASGEVIGGSKKP